MFKQLLLIMFLSVLTIVFKIQLGHALDSVVYLHNIIARALHVVFSDDQIGRLIQDMIALILIPLFVGLLVGGSYWMIKREPLHQVKAIVWVVWLVLLVTMVAQSGVTSARMLHRSTTSMSLRASYDS